MRTLVTTIALLSVTWTAASAGTEADGGRPAVALRVCDALDRRVIAEVLEGYLPELRFQVDSGAGVGVPLSAELCFDGEMVVSTVTNTDTGSSNTQLWPMPADATGRSRERLAAHVLGDQIRGVLFATQPGAPSAAGAGPSDDEPPSTPADRPMQVDVHLALAFDAVGGLTHRTDAASIALGPGLRAGVILGRNGVVGLGLRSLTVIGGADDLPLVEMLPLWLEGGWAGSVGPVELQGLLQVIAERWSPSGAAWAGGWRAGLGMSAGLVVPIGWILCFRLDFGIEFFPEGHTLGYTTETTGETVADLSNWRWRAAAGLEFRIPLL